MRRTIINKRKNKTRKTKLIKKRKNKSNKKGTKKNIHKKKQYGGDFNLREQDYLRRFLNKIYDEIEVEELMKKINERSALEQKPGKFSYHLLSSIFVNCINMHSRYNKRDGYDINNLKYNINNIRDCIKSLLNKIYSQNPDEDRDTDDEESIDEFTNIFRIKKVDEFEKMVNRILPNKLY